MKDAFLRPKMIFLLWLINFLFASVLYFLVSGFLTDVLSRSGSAVKLMEKGDFNVLLDILVHHGERTGTLFSVALILLFFYSLVAVFLKGGILFSLKETVYAETDEKGKKFASMFFEGAGRFFGRFFRLLIYSLILWAGFIIINLFFHFFAGVITAGGGNERMIFIMFWVRLAVFLFFSFFVLMVLDYARIKIVLENSRKVFKEMFWALGFVISNLGRTLGLYYLLVAAGILIIAVALLIDTLIPRTGLLLVVTAFAWGQIFILARSWLTVAFQAAQMRFLAAGKELPAEKREA